MRFGSGGGENTPSNTIVRTPSEALAVYFSFSILIYPELSAGTQTET
jgi:hypothetical protein